MPRDKSRADKIISFINLLPLVDGENVGQRFKVDPWAEQWIRDIYEPVSASGNRLVRRAVLSVARKNAKSYLVAGLLLCHLIGPEALPNGQIFSCAVDRMQARVIFDMCRKMIEATPSLQKALKVIPSTSTILVKRTDLKGRGSVYRALSAEASTKHGLGPSFFVYDEFGEARNSELWNTMLDGQQAVASPLAVVISTQNNDPMHPLSQLIDDGLKRDENGKKIDETIVCHVHAADDDCDLLDEAQWLKANPSLATWKKRDAIAAAAAEASRLPAQEANFRRRYLNQRVSALPTLISQKEWRACRHVDEDGEDAPLEFIENGIIENADGRKTVITGEPVYLALDMARKKDLTALVMVSATNGSRVNSWFWKPSDYVDDHTKKDGVRYDVWAKQGHLLTCPGPLIVPRDMAEKIGELCAKYQVLGLAYDRYATDTVLYHLDAIGLETHTDENSHSGGLRLVPWGQGFASMSPAVDAFEQSILTRDLIHDGNPLLTFCVMNTLINIDPAGNRKLDKDKSKFCIDGSVALAMALGLKVKDGSREAIVSPFEDENYTLPFI